jgi:hypothetical protein
MLTVFTTPKPFVGHIDIIQRNALESWRVQFPDMPILMIGSETGAAQVADELGITFVPTVERHLGIPFLSSLFNAALTYSSSNILAFVNTDIILPRGLIEGAEYAYKTHRNFMIIGQRHDIAVTQLIDFKTDWRAELLALTRSLHPVTGIDYFIFNKELWDDLPEMPPYVVAGTSYDNHLVWAASQVGTLIDATDSFLVLHQNHAYRKETIKPWIDYNKSLFDIQYLGHAGMAQERLCMHGDLLL